MTNKHIIGMLLAKELKNDSRYANLSFDAAMSAIEIDKPTLGAKAYLLCTAYKHGLSQLKKNEKHFAEQAKSLLPKKRQHLLAQIDRKIEYRKVLIEESKSIRKEVRARARLNDDCPF